ncbi:MAG: polysaccharide deacetylase family protein [Coriobacteriales bacterium]|jgi:peptidoglycan/xylan/chitin deacetylase (PgdA/CDA1 family)|nr:polysaccharide deacetylase family protein [Coriobacteriales bacterium]
MRAAGEDTNPRGSRRSSVRGYPARDRTEDPRSYAVGSYSARNAAEKSRARGLKAVLVCVVLIALALALTLAGIIWFSQNPGSNPDEGAGFLGQPAGEQSAPAASYTITLDVSANPGAALSHSSVSAELGTSVERLPFATLAGMRFTGWYTAPPGDPAAVKVDNASLNVLARDSDQTLYAGFETRPSSTDYDNPGLPILMYHYFYDPENGETGEDANWLDIRLFREHLAFLQSNAYYFPDWEEVVAYIRGEILLPERSIVLTSDDGAESFFRLAAPLALEYGARMTSFIVLIDLLPERLEAYDPTRIFIQSHSYDMHRGGSDGDARILTASYQEIYDDAIRGKEILGTMWAYCYPFGKTNDTARAALSDAGVGVALVIENDRAYPLCDPMQVPRLRINDGTTAEYLASVAY